MRNTRYLLPVVLALAAAGCSRSQQTYVIDPATGRTALMQPAAQARFAQQSEPAAASGERGLFNTWRSAPQPQYAQATYQAPSSGRGLMGAPQTGPVVSAQPAPRQPDDPAQHGGAQHAPAAQPPQYAPPVAFNPPRDDRFVAAALY